MLTVAFILLPKINNLFLDRYIYDIDLLYIVINDTPMFATGKTNDI